MPGSLTGCRGQAPAVRLRPACTIVYTSPPIQLLIILCSYSVPGCVFYAMRNTLVTYRLLGYSGARLAVGVKPLRSSLQKANATFSNRYSYARWVVEVKPLRSTLDDDKCRQSNDGGTDRVPVVGVKPLRPLHAEAADAFDTDSAVRPTVSQVASAEANELFPRNSMLVILLPPQVVAIFVATCHTCCDVLRSLLGAPARGRLVPSDLFANAARIATSLRLRSLDCGSTAFALKYCALLPSSHSLVSPPQPAAPHRTGPLQCLSCRLFARAAPCVRVLGRGLVTR